MRVTPPAPDSDVAFILVKSSGLLTVLQARRPLRGHDQRYDEVYREVSADQ